MLVRRPKIHDSPTVAFVQIPELNSLWVWVSVAEKVDDGGLKILCHCGIDFWYKWRVWIVLCF